MSIVKRPLKIEGNKVVRNYNEALTELKEGNTVCMYEDGMSLVPILLPMEYCRLVPINSNDEVKEGDVVLCNIPRVGMMIHRVIEIIDTENRGKWFKIGSTSGDFFGFTQEIFAIGHSTDVFEEKEESSELLSSITILQKLIHNGDK